MNRVGIFDLKILKYNVLQSYYFIWYSNLYIIYITSSSEFRMVSTSDDVTRMYSRICPSLLSTAAASGHAATIASPNARADSLWDWNRNNYIITKH